MASEDAAVSVQFVENDIPQIFKQASPLGVVGQDPGVQHIGVGNDDVALLADGLPGVSGRIAIVGEHPETCVETAANVMQLRQLVLCERLGREDVQGARVGVL